MTQSLTNGTVCVPASTSTVHHNLSPFAATPLPPWKLDPPPSEFGGLERLDARELRKALLGQPTDFRLRADYRGCYLAEELNLDDQRLTTTLSLPGLLFAHRFTARDARLDRSANLAGCHFAAGLMLDGCRVAGMLVLDGSRVHALGDNETRQVDPKNPDDTAAVAVSLRHLRVGRSLQAKNMTAGGTVLLTEARVDAQLILDGLAIHPTAGLDLQNVVVGADVLCRSIRPGAAATRLGRQLWMDGAQVGADLDLRGVCIAGNAHLENARVHGDLVLYMKPRAGGRPPRTEIAGNLSMSGIQVRGAVKLCGALVRGDVVLTGGRVRGDLLADTPETPDLPTTFGGSVRLDSAQVDGRADLTSALIAGRLSATRAVFDDGLRLDHVSVDGGTAGPDRPAAIDLSHAVVNGTLSLAGGRVRGRLRLQAAKVAGDLLVGNDNPTATEWTDCGRIEAANLVVSGQARFTGLRVDEPSDRHGFCIDLRFGRVRTGCRLPGDAAVVARVGLFHARFGELRLTCVPPCRLPGTTLAPDDPTPADTPTVELEADGLAFSRLTVPDEDYIHFLDRTHPFQRGTYQAVERHLRESGQDEPANAVYRAMRRRERRSDIGIGSFLFDVLVFDVLGGLRHRTWLRRGVRLFKERYVAWRNQSSGFWPRTWSVVRQSGSPWYHNRAVCAGLIVVAAGMCLVRRHSVAVIPAVLLLPLALHILRWLWHMFLDLTTGYGTESRRIGAGILMVFAAFWFLFAQSPKSVRRVVNPTRTELQAVATEVAKARAAPGRTVPAEEDFTAHDLNKEWTTWDAMYLAMRTAVPLVDVVADKDWEPSDEPITCAVYGEPIPLGWTTYEKASSLFSAIGYVTIPLFLASVSGWLKRRGE